MNPEEDVPAIFLLTPRPGLLIQKKCPPSKILKMAIRNATLRATLNVPLLRIQNYPNSLHTNYPLLIKHLESPL